MAEIKKTVRIDWSETLTSMEINALLEAPLTEKDFALRRANYLKSTGKGVWSIVSDRKGKTITVKRIS